MPKRTWTYTTYGDVTPRGYRLGGDGLSAGRLGRVQPAGRNEFRPAMAHADFPAGLITGLMNHPVMSPAQHHQILNVRLAAVDPFTDVMQCH